MKIFKYLERIELMHKLVDHENTGSPQEFASRLGISRTRLYEIMDYLKMEGAPIAYSKSCRTFYYSEPFHISISVELKALNASETKSTNGGKFFISTFFPDSASVTSYCKLTTC